MSREQAINYLRSSGMSEEQINTVVDALTPTVRCNDCKYYMPMSPRWDIFGMQEKLCCNHPMLKQSDPFEDAWIETEPNSYCSYGERREDGQI